MTDAELSARAWEFLKAAGWDAMSLSKCNTLLPSLTALLIAVRDEDRGECAAKCLQVQQQFAVSIAEQSVAQECRRRIEALPQ